MEMFQLLIVDDEVAVLDGLALTLPWQELGVGHVYRAENGFEALELLKQHPIDIVMTDIRMPGMSGLELIRVIRENWAGIKTVILSGHGEFHYAQEALRAETEDFLLKPVRAEDVERTIRRVQDKLKQEWESLNSRQRMSETLQEHLPLLRNNALYDLLVGRFPDRRRLADKLRLLDIPFAEGDEVFLMHIRIEDGFAAYDPGSLSLFEFAIGNIATEIFGRQFHSWSTTDPNDYLVVALKARGTGAVAEMQPNSAQPDIAQSGHALAHAALPVSAWANFAQSEPAQSGFIPSDTSSDEAPFAESLTVQAQQAAVERLADQLQKTVLTYLKGKISIVVSRPGQFPSELRQLYDTNLKLLRHRIGSDQGILFAEGNGEAESAGGGAEAGSLDHLYRTPNLMQLLEAGKWDEAGEKLTLIFGELQDRFADSREHLAETYHGLAASFAYVSHKNGRLLSSLIDRKPEPSVANRQDDFHSIHSLRQWASEVLRLMRADMEYQIRSARSSIVAKVNQYIFSHLSEDISLQRLADQVHLHPAYLSKIYKLETDETFSDYVHRVKMDKAASMLKSSNERIYRIAQEIGFDNTYFTRVFKKHFGLTPQEYRDR